MVDDAHEVEGYVTCDSGPHWVLREVAAKTGGLCVDCFIESGGERRRIIEVVGRGARLQIPISSRRPRRREMTDARRRSKKTAERARTSALKRLAAMFPDLFDIVLAEERAALGLKPFTTDMAVRNSGDVNGEMAQKFAELDLALEREGID